MCVFSFPPVFRCVLSSDCAPVWAIPTLSEKFEGGFYGSAVAGLEYKNFTFGAGFTHQEMEYKNGYTVDANGVRTDNKEKGQIPRWLHTARRFYVLTSLSRQNS